MSSAFEPEPYVHRGRFERVLPSFCVCIFRIRCGTELSKHLTKSAATNNYSIFSRIRSVYLARIPIRSGLSLTYISSACASFDSCLCISNQSVIVSHDVEKKNKKIPTHTHTQTYAYRQAYTWLDRIECICIITPQHTCGNRRITQIQYTRS